MSDWKNVQYKDGKMRTSSGGGGGASALTDLSDVNVSSPSNGQVLKYDNSTSKWVNANESGSFGHTYSTTEQVVGTWIDGKPIYEISIPFTISGTVSGNIRYFLQSTGVTNVDKVIDNSGWWYTTTDNRCFVFGTSEFNWSLQPSYASYCRVDSTGELKIYIIVNKNNYTETSISGVAVARYTKTTD